MDYIIAALIGATVSAVGIILNNFLTYKNKKKTDAYSLYITKKIEVYNKLHKNIMLSSGQFYSTYEHNSTEPDLEKFNIDEIKEYLKKKKIGGGKIKTFVTMWKEKGETDAIGEIRQYIYKGEPNIVENTINKASNSYVENIFYFSEEVGEIAKNLIKDMRLYNDEQQTIRVYGRSRGEKECEDDNKRIKELKVGIENSKELLLGKMKSEIKSYGLE